MFTSRFLTMTPFPLFFFRTPETLTPRERADLQVGVQREKEMAFRPGGRFLPGNLRADSSR